MSKPIALIIEDDPQLGQILSIALEDDFQVEVIAEGDAALKRLGQGPQPRIVILDLNLPAVPGKDLLAHIRSDPHLKDIIVMLTTADERQAESLQGQADFILLKPVSPIQVKQMAARLV
jgi:CheY-like chemotaxis protein